MTSPQSTIITIKNLSFTYPDGTSVFDSLSLDIISGETLGIIGPNGAGKSTLLLHLNGIFRGKGTVKIADMDINTRNIPKIRNKVGLVFQDPDTQLFMPTVLEDVAFGPLNMGYSVEKAKASALEALDKVQMKEHAGKCPHHLSLGQKKRVAIAAVLAMSPEIVVFDEPSSNLDPRQRRILINFINHMECTRIIATHDLEMVLEVCSRVVLLSGGTIITTGAPHDILARKTLLEEHSLEVPCSLKNGDRLEY